MNSGDRLQAVRVDDIDSAERRVSNEHATGHLVHVAVIEVTRLAGLKMNRCRQLQRGVQVGSPSTSARPHEIEKDDREQKHEPEVEVAWRA